ncbi:MAG: 4-alpha-glucanotransferase [Oscillospiraceae bacterium]|nr:4-alpha-glucanotransferase [Oscillospiraceae bacterium]
MTNRRRSGIVLPVFSLPSPQGIGTFGQSAYRFIDFLVLAGQSDWQILPLSPTGFGDSPYQSCSARAGNPYFIDLEILEREGLLEPDDYRFADFGQNVDRADYAALYRERPEVLRKAWTRGRETLREALDAFREENRSWLPDYALYMAVKAKFGMAALRDWPDERILRRDPESLTTYRTLLAREVEYHEFVQLLFYRQWADLKAYAEEKGIRIIGDVPIYVAEDSVEVWAEGHLFQLAGPGRPSRVAGVPPDLFSDTGQLWGNPLYDWKVHQKDGYAWWIDRLRHAARFFDVIRVDHFRGFYNYWAVEAGEETAEKGVWEYGPGMDFIRAVREALPEVELIAEDLGELDAEAIAFIRESGIPGMSVSIYGFDPCGDGPYLAHNVGRDTAAYTTTHDSPTFVGWLHGEASEASRDFANAYLRLSMEEGAGWGAVKSVWGTAARRAMAPLQDILGLSNDARINLPSTLGGNNWRWRIREEALNEHVAGLLRFITGIYRRLPPPPETEAEPEVEAGDGD